MPSLSNADQDSSRWGLSEKRTGKKEAALGQAAVRPQNRTPLLCV